MSATVSDHAAAPRTTNPNAVLSVLLLGQFMAVLDVFIVNVAAPTLRTDLHASGAGVQLAVAGYLISYAMLLITGARLGDRFGHGRMFRAGLAGFTVTSLLCGLAPTTTTLVAFRVLQGASAAVMMPQVMSLIQRTFEGAARARALSLYSAVIACGAVVGQVLGGVIVSADLFGSSWRPVFLVNVPVGLVLLGLARRRLPDDRGERSRRADLPGVLTLSLSVLAFVLPLVLGHEERWPLWCRLSLAASPVLFAAFVMVERRVAATGGSPLVSGRVLRAPGLLVGVATLLLAMVAYAGFLFAITLHLQGGLGESAAHAGLTFAPAAFGFAVAGLTWRRLPERWYGPLIAIGLAVTAVGYLTLAPILHSGGSGGIALESNLLAIGLALGLAFGPMMNAALTHVPVAEAADASGVLISAFQLGQVIGVATIGTLFLSLDDAPGAIVSAHAFSTTLVVLAGAALLAAGFAWRLARV